jgi:hypothetical protein
MTDAELDELERSLISARLVLDYNLRDLDGDEARTCDARIWNANMNAHRALSHVPEMLIAALREARALLMEARSECPCEGCNPQWMERVVAHLGDKP